MRVQRLQFAGAWVPRCLNFLSIRELFHGLDQYVSTRALTIGRKNFVHGGSSGIGLTAIQLAHAFVAKVFCTVGNSDKVVACLKAGADVASNYQTQDFDEEILRLTVQQSVNALLDMVGGQLHPAQFEGPGGRRSFAANRIFAALQSRSRMGLFDDQRFELHGLHAAPA